MEAGKLRWHPTDEPHVIRGPMIKTLIPAPIRSQPHPIQPLNRRRNYLHDAGEFLRGSRSRYVNRTRCSFKYRADLSIDLSIYRHSLSQNRTRKTKHENQGKSSDGRTLNRSRRLERINRFTEPPPATESIPDRPKASGVIHGRKDEENIWEGVTLAEPA
jgi:hypothetical protein